MQKSVDGGVASPQERGGETCVRVGGDSTGRASYVFVRVSLCVSVILFVLLSF